VAPEDILKQVAEEASKCSRCALHHSRKLAVPGEGPANAEILFIGEGPGFYENEQGRPFVGAAGKFLDELLTNANLTRSEVFITNVVKCRPPGNRDPLPEELAACSDYLERQIQAINPRVIVTLGRYSMATFLPNAKISEVHGQSMRIKGRLIIPMYHPAAALHQQSLKATVQQDFARLPELIARAKSQPTNELAQSGTSTPTMTGQSTGDEPAFAAQEQHQKKEEPKQLSLF
jgi:uracil-DNA glycosylase